MLTYLIALALIFSNINVEALHSLSHPDSILSCESESPPRRTPGIIALDSNKSQNYKSKASLNKGVHDIRKCCELVTLDPNDVSDIFATLSQHVLVRLWSAVEVVVNIYFIKKRHARIIESSCLKSHK